jgi:hypothetical protein
MNIKLGRFEPELVDLKTLLTPGQFRRCYLCKQLFENYGLAQPA